MTKEQSLVYINLDGGQVLWKNKKGQLFSESRRDVQWINITEDMEPIAEDAKVYCSDTAIYYLTNDNKLYKGIDNSLLAENVKEVYNNFERYVYYLTNDNKLYGYDERNNSLELVAENIKDVKECYGSEYLTNDNKLYRYDGILIAENVKESYNDYPYYLTNDNKLYIIYDNSLLAENVKEFYADLGLYITNDNKLYADNDLIAENVKDVKEFYGSCYLTNDNKFYKYDGSNYILVAENVKEVYADLGFYLTNDNKLYADNLIAENVKEVYKTYSNNYYLTNDNKLYVIGESNNNVLIAENVKKFYHHYYDYAGYYLTNDNKLYDLYDSNKKLYKLGENSLIAENMEEVDDFYYQTSDGLEYICINSYMHL